MIKTCSKCKVEKDEEEFRFQNKAQGKRAAWCKVCFSLHEKNNYHGNAERRARIRGTNKSRVDRNRRYVYDYLTGKACLLCPESDPVVLEFDHRDPSEKRGAISDMIYQGASIKALDEEFAKCDVMCANCHRRRTSQQFGYYSWLSKE